MFKAVTSYRAGGSRTYGYVLLWASDKPRPSYMLSRHMHWYRYKADAVFAAARLNKSLEGGVAC
jgi:hypothetical protein